MYPSLNFLTTPLLLSTFRLCLTFPIRKGPRSRRGAAAVLAGGGG